MPKAQHILYHVHSLAYMNLYTYHACPKRTSLIVETHSKWKFRCRLFLLLKPFVHLSTHSLLALLFIETATATATASMLLQYWYARTIFDFRFPIEFLFVSRFNSPVFRIFHLRFNVYFVYLFVYFFFSYLFGSFSIRSIAP